MITILEIDTISEHRIYTEQDHNLVGFIVVYNFMTKMG